jgi:hypothetical protein
MIDHPTVGKQVSGLNVQLQQPMRVNQQDHSGGLGRHCQQ